MTVPVLVDSVNKAGEKAKCAGYAELLFTGGGLNLSLTEEKFELLRNREGENVNCVFKLRVSKTINRFGKQGIGFEPVEILEIEG